jgi:hypothetical protein
VIRGEIDNTERGRVTGTIWLLGRDQPMTLDLAGDAWPDLAGCKMTFVNTNPLPQPEYDEGLRMRQTGSAGDITASQKLKKLLVPEGGWMKAIEERRFHEIPWVLSNSLYLEWYSDSNGRVVIQSTDYEITVSEKKWEADPDEQAAQQAINEANMRTYMEDLARAVEQQDAPDDEGRERQAG